MSERLQWVLSKVRYPLWQERAVLRIVSRLAGNRRECASLILPLIPPLLRHRAASLVPGALGRQALTLRVQGATFIVALGAAEIDVLEEIYLDHFYDQVADFVPKAGWVVFDIGANVGVFAIQQAGRGARVYAFEPNRGCYRRMVRAIGANGLVGSIATFSDALGAAQGVGVMEVPGGATPGGMVRPSEDMHPPGGPAVPITSLDAVVPSLQVERIDLLKIDVEGAELEVLRGAARTLGCVERVVVEYHSPDLRAQVGAHLASSGFSLVLQVGMDALITGRDSSRWRGQGIIYARRSALVGENPARTAGG